MKVIKEKKITEKISVAIFDFDGTISTLRHGWECIMKPLMLEMICPNDEIPKEVIAEVDSYIDESTGVQTIYQMEWLAEKVKFYGFAQEHHDAWWYKQQYNEKLLDMVRQRIDLINNGEKHPSDYRIIGSLEFVKCLYEKGVKVYIASGTDDIDLQKEIEIIGISTYVTEAKGAPHLQKDCSKDKILRTLLADDGLNIPPHQIAVFGDGKVEIQLASSVGAIAIGVATDEINRHGINITKQKKLVAAGADSIIDSFSDLNTLLTYLGL